MFGNVRRNGGETTFANFNAKTGLFQIGNKANRQTFDALTDVYLRRIVIKENPNFDDKTKMDKQIGLSFRNAAGENALVTFSLTQFAVKALGLVNAADLTKPMSLAGGAFPKGSENKNLETGEITIREEDQPFLVGYQGDTKLKAKFSDDPEFKIPKVEVIEVKNGRGEVINKVRDTTNRDDFILAFATELAAKINVAAQQQPAPDPTKKPAAAPAPEPTDAAGEDAPGLNARDFAAEDGGEADENAWREDAPSA
jgi:hypothetical protein